MQYLLVQPHDHNLIANAAAQAKDKARASAAHAMLSGCAITNLIV